MIRKILDFYRDPEYFSEVRKIAVPIIIQQLMFSGLNLLGVVFVGDGDFRCGGRAGRSDRVPVEPGSHQHPAMFIAILE
jgi:hypothetical protein